MALSCHRATSPAAVNATLLFHHDNDNRNLWERANQSVPLPTCSSPDAPDSLCQVCMRDRQVYAFCHNLLDRVGLVMEGTDSGSSINLVEIECPVFPSEHQPNFHIGVIISVLLLLLLLLLVAIGFVFYQKWKHENVPSDGGNAAATETEINN